MLVEPPRNSQSDQHQDEEEDGGNGDDGDWRQRPTKAISALEASTGGTLQSNTAVTYQYMRKRTGWEWEKPETVSWGGGYVSDTPCWTRGCTSSPPPPLLYTCAFIYTVYVRKTPLAESTLVGWFHETLTWRSVCRPRRPDLGRRTSPVCTGTWCLRSWCRTPSRSRLEGDEKQDERDKL